jgi:4-hydroxythreonine-4-phosphate dehydrogenase
MASDKPIIAIATGDPAGIGPEISLKAALDPAVRAACRPILVGDATILERHAVACGISARLHPVARIEDAGAAGARLPVLDCPQPDAVPLGAISAAAGRASIAFCGAAVKAALSKQVAAVVAAPQNETSIAMAGIPFDGHPSFVARETGTREDHVFMMLCFGDTKIAHATLHQSVRQALDAITRERVALVIDETARTLQRMGIAAPKIAVSGLNPHAGEGGLFGREEIDIIKPAIDAAVANGLAIAGPFGADTMFHMPGFDAFVVMLHDQGHVAAKLLAENAAAALAIGTPILFSSVAHGSAHDIAGKGVADPKAMIEAVLRMAGARPRVAQVHVAQAHGARS